MKRYIVVKHNLMRDQKFYLMAPKEDCWTIHKPFAHKYLTRWAAQKIVDQKEGTLSPALAHIRYGVEVAK